MEMTGLTIWDFLLFPVYLFIINSIFKKIRRKYEHNAVLTKYFTYGYKIKIIFVIVFTLLTSFILKGDGVTLYLDCGRIIAKALPQNPYLIFIKGGEIPNSFAPDDYSGYLKTDANYMVVKVCAILCWLTFSNYLLINLIIGFIVFLASWYLFLFFRYLYPTIEQSFAIACMGIPTVLFWSAGIGKDAICFASICLFTKFMFDILILRKGSLLKLAICILAVYLAYSAKSYIIICYFPFYFLFLILTLINQTKHFFLKVLLKIFIPILFIGIVGYIFTSSNEMFADFASDKILDGVLSTQGAFKMQAATMDGSFFTLGDFDGTIQGLLLMAPKAIVATLFRPYIWESRNLVMLISALESTFIVLFTVSLFFRRKGLITVIKSFSLPIVIYTIGFTVFFSVFVGISANNFGSLVRYKIPCMPFFLISLFIINNEIKKANN